MSCSKLSNYICHHCGSSNETAGGLRKHRIPQHEKEKMRITCMECDCHFMNNADLTAHWIDKHGSKVWHVMYFGMCFQRRQT